MNGRNLPFSCKTNGTEGHKAKDKTTAHRMKQKRGIQHQRKPGREVVICISDIYESLFWISIDRYTYIYISISYSLTRKTSRVGGRKGTGVCDVHFPNTRLRNTIYKYISLSDSKGIPPREKSQGHQSLRSALA